VFGPLVALGPLAELIGDAAFRPAPLTDVDADELVQSGKAGKLLSGFRGAEPADTTALADVVLRVARLVDDLADVAELDLNPVIAKADGCVVVDARVRISPRTNATQLKSW
jgi:acyl-CoA synthetase (NDP forming)